MKIVVALGGNAIVQHDERGTARDQLRNIGVASQRIVEMISKGHHVVVTHGNGPQSGNLLIQQEEGSDLVPPQPLDVLGAMTQGQLGYLIQQSLANRLKHAGLKTPVFTIVTQVLVDRDDPDFKNPSKPVGPFYTERESKRLWKNKGYVIRKVKPRGAKSYRRVVPSPDPIAIIEKEAIKAAFQSGGVLIASGGGGIPVMVAEDGTLVGVEAVIDKDLAAEKLAQVVGADVLLILTDVETVKLNYGKPNQKDLRRMTVDEVAAYYREGYFMAGNMAPKILACMRFVKSGGRMAVITSLEKAGDALEGKTGTVISAA